MEWISVKDRLPEKECLAIGYQGLMLIGWLSNNGVDGFVCESDGEVLTEVTHWQSLPEPPNQ